MKKFYIPVFTAVFLLSSFLSQAQVTYNSITSNPLAYTLDDARFWVGGVPPPNPCNLCTINIYTDVTMVPENGGLATNGGVQTTAADGPFLNDVTVSNGSINIYGNTTLTINTYVQFFNAVFTLGNDPTSPEAIYFNDQIDLNGTSSIQLANQYSLVNTNNDIIDGGNGKTILGPHNVGPRTVAGIYTIRTASPGPVNTVDKTLNGFSTENYNQTYVLPSNTYMLNCNPINPLNDCTAGIVYGPAITQYTGTPTDFYGFVQSTTLPVVLVLFVANKEDDGTVGLNWATSQEQNSGYYDVERSGDQAAWSKIGSVKAKGYSSTTTNYNFTDKLPLDGGGYYRLKMVDNDGKFKYSKTVSVNSSTNAQALVIYSNPFSDQIRMKVNVSRSQNLVMTVSDLLGKTYINQNYHAQSGDNFINLSPNTSSTGMYILHIHGDSYDQTVKLAKQ